MTPTWAAKLLEDGCILGDFEGPFLHVRDFSRVFDVRLSTICFHREFCTHQDCAFFHTEEEKELFEKNGGISPYRYFLLLSELIFFCNFTLILFSLFLTF